jgi:hypothetical protein
VDSVRQASAVVYAMLHRELERQIVTEVMAQRDPHNVRGKALTPHTMTPPLQCRAVGLTNIRCALLANADSARPVTTSLSRARL